MRTPHELWSIVYRHYSNRNKANYHLCNHVEVLYIRDIISKEECNWIATEIRKDCKRDLLSEYLYETYSTQLDYLQDATVSTVGHILRCLYLQDKIIGAIGK